jgi:hypothetical protein
MLSPKHVRDGLDGGDVPNVQAIQELVTAFKLLWKWRRRG